MLVQILFFYIIASKQVDVIITSKADILKNYMQNSTNAKEVVNLYMNSEIFKDKKDKAKNTAKKRLEINRYLIWLKLKPLLITVAIIIGISLCLIFLFGFNRFTKIFATDNVDSYTLSLI